MGRAEIRFEIQNKDIADEIERKIRRGIKRSTGQQISDGISDQIEFIAKERIRSEGAIWTGELIESFAVDYDNGREVYRVTIENVAEHAAPLEYGAEYTDRGPPVSALIPWVQTKMPAYDPPDEELDDLPPIEDMRSTIEEEQINEPAVNLTELVPKDVLQRAFWLQQQIKRRGIEPIRFMEAAHEWTESSADRTVADYIHRELSKI